MEDINIGERLIIKDKVYFVMTQNCPFSCDQCMRGDKIPKKITKAVIDAVLSQILIYGKITLSGGESLMVLKEIAYLMQRLYELGNEPTLIEVITNGSISPAKFEEFVKIMDTYDAPLFVVISNDYYHFKERIKLTNGVDNIHRVHDSYKNIMDKYGYNPNNCKLEKYQGAGVGVSAIGRGVNIPGAIERNRNFDIHKSVRIVDGVIKGGLQIMCDGSIFPVVDMSWKEASDNRYINGNIKNNSLRRML